MESLPQRGQIHRTHRTTYAVSEPLALPVGGLFPRMSSSFGLTQAPRGVGWVLGSQGEVSLVGSPGFCAVWGVLVGGRGPEVPSGLPPPPSPPCLRDPFTKRLPRPRAGFWGSPFVRFNV